MHVLQKVVESVVVDSQTNATATATLAAAGTGLKWRVTGWRASFSGAAVATPVRATATGMGGVTIGRGVSTNDGWECNLVTPLESAVNGQPAISIPTGGIGAVGDVSIYAYKVPSTLSD